jgi:hypothetical protein
MVFFSAFDVQMLRVRVSLSYLGLNPMVQIVRMEYSQNIYVSLFNRLFYGAVVTAEDIQRQKSKIYGRKE